MEPIWIPTTLVSYLIRDWKNTCTTIGLAPPKPKAFCRKDPITNLTIRERIEDNTDMVERFFGGSEGNDKCQQQQNDLGVVSGYIWEMKIYPVKLGWFNFSDVFDPCPGNQQGFHGSCHLWYCFFHCSCVNSSMQPILRSTMAMSEGSFSFQSAHTHRDWYVCVYMPSLKQEHSASKNYHPKRRAVFQPHFWGQYFPRTLWTP